MSRVSLIFLAFWMTTLGGCVYHPPIQQGNIITNKNLRTLHKGMTKDQVRTVLGDPVLVNIFSDNRMMIYVYTFQCGHHRRIQSVRLIIYLRNNRVTDFWTGKNEIIGRTNLSNS